MGKKIVIKMGTAFLLKANTDQLIKQLIKIKQEYDALMVVTSGATGYGKKIVEKEKSIAGRLGQKELAAIGQGVLFGEYYKYFSRQNIVTAQILVTRKVQEKVLNNLLKKGVVPIINGNDPDCTQDLMYNDNDSLAGDVAIATKANQVIILTDIDGVYDFNPCRNKNAKKFKVLHRIPKALLDNSKETGSSVGTGGMYTKLKMARKLLNKNIDIYITSSMEDVGVFLANNNQGKGTLITAQ